MASFLIILSNSQRSPKFLALFDLRRRKLMNLVRLKTPSSNVPIIAGIGRSEFYS